MGRTDLQVSIIVVQAGHCLDLHSEQWKKRVQNVNIYDQMALFYQWFGIRLYVNI